MVYYYSSSNAMDLFNSLFLYKASTILHLICKNNHVHLFDLIKDQYKDEIDINLENEIGETPIMITLNEKHITIADKILRDFKD